MKVVHKRRITWLALAFQSCSGHFMTVTFGGPRSLIPHNALTHFRFTSLLFTILHSRHQHSIGMVRLLGLDVRLPVLGHARTTRKSVVDPPERLLFLRTRPFAQMCWAGMDAALIVLVFSVGVAQIGGTGRLLT